ncbi:PREDICTED: LOW QUALITY PROTEIN: flavin-containing monooxygenase FMO GS-OX-like 6 [Camelina sativa]|uniref:Flavin-containing monooxygenase n=1 Tax=Camelina sativa TaxID=90675 RepID=A0ABM0WU25_CAMSA|nr:PREDICTED: LOW QUALITY PROTEIN: flavin-containing monooxygenase FMO GS-OX-like 6 [Camelina sativa]
MAPPPNSISSRHVAVIGAGAAGLVAARELCREGHTVTVFERQKQVGGLWVYTPNVETDLLSIDPDRNIVHSSVYQSLRTNLPRECMGYCEFPFVTRPDDDSRDPRRYPDHREVMMYLQDFAKEFKIDEMIRFQTEVVRVEPAAENSLKWIVQSKSSRGVFGKDIFDAVVVCNGHFTEPRLAHIPGIDTWPGKQIHSHNYRVPDPFKDQVVVVIGNQSSGRDISKDIATLAKEVHIAAKSLMQKKESADAYKKESSRYSNIHIHQTIDRAYEDGSVVFQDGEAVFADAIVHCTGYKYRFPFLETNDYVTVEDNRVGTLYKHVFPPALAPGLSFIGLPSMALQFFMFEIQSKWVASVLSGRIKLPSEDKMMEDVTAFYAKLKSLGIPKRFTHFLTDPQFTPMFKKLKPHEASLISQYEYFNWVSEQCGCSSIGPWRVEQYNIAIKKNDDTYRDDECDDDDQLLEEAYRDFAKFKPSKVCSTHCH